MRWASRNHLVPRPKAKDRAFGAPCDDVRGRAGSALSLDRLDEAILDILEQSARLPNRELARRVGLSDSACLERVRRLERIGVILGYRADISPTARGMAFEAWANISLSDLAPGTAAKFEALIKAHTYVARAFRVTGHCDFVVQFSGPSQAEWRAFCVALEQIGIGPGQVRLALTIGQVKPPR